MAGIRSWGYQLQKADPAVIARSPYDLVVVDYSRTGDDESLFAPDAVKAMQTKPDGSRRLVLAYLSIGEAEQYRFYWNADWVEPLQVAATEDGAIVKGGESLKAGPTVKGAGAARPLATKTLHVPRLSAPIWLGRENENWTGNFLVRYWEKDWQRIIFGSSKSYLEQIIAAGFDGVFLDRVDAFHGVTDERLEGKDDMVRFVSAIARHARALKPGFVIVPQNGEELLLEPAYLAAIDAIAKEDLLYGNPAEGQPNPPDLVAKTMNWLRPAQRIGLPVLVVEYTLDKAIADRVRPELAAQSFIPYFAERSLDRLILAEDLRIAPPQAKVTGKAGQLGSLAPGGGRERKSRRR